MFGMKKKPKIEVILFPDGRFPDASAREEIGTDLTPTKSIHGYTLKVLPAKEPSENLQRQRYFYLYNNCIWCSDRVRLACLAFDLSPEKRSKYVEPIKVSYRCLACTQPNTAECKYADVFPPHGQMHYLTRCNCGHNYCVLVENKSESYPQEIWHRCPSCQDGGLIYTNQVHNGAQYPSFGHGACRACTGKSTVTQTYQTKEQMEMTKP
ncbi:MAG: hypothetical protein K2X29_14120 [Candidatus Obscuribacterales bacterium]|nr:hypothetical protein [Candidatus Obscuribacterales bacterium]